MAEKPLETIATAPDHTDDPGGQRMTPFQASILEAVEAGGDLVKAIHLCATLLKDCHCQNSRRAEAERALCVTNLALGRWGLALSNVGNTANRIKRNRK